MKIELKMNGKKLFTPQFKMLYNNEKDNFVIGILYNEKYSYSFVRQDLIENFENFEIKGTNFIYSSKDNIYIFDLKNNFNLLPLAEFKHGIVLLNESGKIIEEDYLKLITDLNENNN